MQALALSTGTFTVAPRRESGNDDLHLHLDVGAALGLAPGRPAAAAVEQAAEQVAQVEAAAPGPPPEKSKPWKPPPAGPWPGRNVWPNVSYCFRLSGSDEHLVRLADLLEALLRRGVAGVAVGVVLARELAVRLLDLVGARALRHAQRLVVRRHSLVLAVGGRAARDDDAGRAHDPVAQPVSALPDGGDGALGLVGRLVGERLVDVRVELVARLARRSPRALGGRSSPASCCFTCWTPSATFASSWCSEASSARSRLSSTGRSSPTSDSVAREACISDSRATRFR